MAKTIEQLRFDQEREPRNMHTSYELDFKVHPLHENYEQVGEIALAHLSSHNAGVVYGSSSLTGMDKETAGKVGAALVAWSKTDPALDDFEEWAGG